eukprot:4989294-Pyramimonas_sp.AAC.1
MGIRMNSVTVRGILRTNAIPLGLVDRRAVQLGDLHRRGRAERAQTLEKAVLARGEEDKQEKDEKDVEGE